MWMCGRSLLAPLHSLSLCVSVNSLSVTELTGGLWLEFYHHPLSLPLSLSPTPSSPYPCLYFSTVNWQTHCSALFYLIDEMLRMLGRFLGRQVTVCMGLSPCECVWLSPKLPCVLRSKRNTTNVGKRTVYALSCITSCLPKNEFGLVAWGGFTYRPTDVVCWNTIYVGYNNLFVSEILSSLIKLRHIIMHDLLNKRINNVLTTTIIKPPIPHNYY